MAPVRAFLAPLVEGPEKKPLQLLVFVPALDSATMRQLSIGSKSIPLDAESHDAAWTFGDAVRLTERDSTNRARQVSAATGGWSVFGLAKQANVRFFNPTTRVELVPPASFPSAAPEIVLSKAAK